MKSIHIAIASTMSKPGAVADNLRQIAKFAEKNDEVVDFDEHFSWLGNLFRLLDKMFMLNLTLKACSNIAYGLNPIYYTHFLGTLSRGHL